MSNQPLDKGRAAVAVEKYQKGTDQQTGQPIMKNRYATIGRATMWPANQGSTNPNIELDIDTMPIGTSGPVKVFIFWDSEQNNQATQTNNPPQNGYVNQSGGFQPQANNGFNNQSR